MPKKLELDNMTPDELLTSLLIDVGHGYQVRPHALKRKVANAFSAYNPQTHRLVPIDIVNNSAKKLEPHAYVPSAMHMGDCSICGHLQGSAIHSLYRRNSGCKLVPITKHKNDVVPIVDRHIIVNSGWDFSGLKRSKRTTKAFAKAHVDEPWDELTLMQQRQWRAIRDAYIKYIHATT